jgi:hypothetical protein
VGKVKSQQFLLSFKPGISLLEQQEGDQLVLPRPQLDISAGKTRIANAILLG